MEQMLVQHPPLNQINETLHQTGNRKSEKAMYETTAPYPFYYTSSESVGKYHKFTSSWIYQREKVSLDFAVVNKKMALTALSIEEKLRDFLFNRFDKEGVIFTDRTNFTTSIELQNKFNR